MSAKNKKTAFQKSRPRKIAVIRGGPGPEKDISYESARAVAGALKRLSLPFFFAEADGSLIQSLKEGKPDIAFLAAHGIYGEDGCPQAVCELLRIPYTGSGVLTSALCMDKIFFKKWLRKSHIASPDFYELPSFGPVSGAKGKSAAPEPEPPPQKRALKKTKRASLKAGAAARRPAAKAEPKPSGGFSSGFESQSGASLKTAAAMAAANISKYPAVVKASHGGSSLGIRIVRKPSELPGALSEAQKIGRRVFIEDYIPHGAEAAVSFLAGRILTPVEIVPKGGFYDYKRKYQKGQSQYHIPPRLDPMLLRKIMRTAKQAFQLSGARGFARADFIVERNKIPWLLEINTLPGLTENSLLPKSARHDGIGFARLIQIILESAGLDYRS